MDACFDIGFQEAGYCIVLLRPLLHILGQQSIHQNEYLPSKSLYNELRLKFFFILPS